MKATAIIILNYNNPADTVQCISRIQMYNTAPIKYIVVDNGSSKDGVFEKLNHYFLQNFSGQYRVLTDEDTNPGELPYLCFLASRTNDGYARGNNKGIRLAYQDDTIDSLLILNNDILFFEDIIPTLRKCEQKRANSGIISPLVYTKDKESIDYNCARKSPSNWQIILHFLFHNRDLFGILSKMKREQMILQNHPELRSAPLFEIEVPSGCCMYVKKSVFMEIGEFDPGTFLYYEEQILHKKLAARHYHSYCVPCVGCIHLGGASTKLTSGSFLWYCNMESANCYLQNYASMSFSQKLVWAMAKGSIYFVDKLKSFAHGRN